MAAIKQHKKSQVYHIRFRYGGRQHHKSLETKVEGKAKAWKTQVEETLNDIERGRLVIPPEADFWEFVKTDGVRVQPLRLERLITVEHLFDWYFKSLPEGGMAKNTLRVQRIHRDHFKRLLGRRPLNQISASMLQNDYVNKRTSEQFHGRRIASQTVRKEIETLQFVWNKAFRQRVEGLSIPCPSSELDYPARREAAPFQTFAQIEQAIGRGGLSEYQVNDLWACVFLNKEEIAEVLKHVKQKETTRAYFYPLLVFVAHTGARLSEALRSQRDDFDFERGKVRIRELKKKKHVETYRTVPLSSLLASVMQEWFKAHPGGIYTFCRLPNKKFHDQTLHDDFEFFMGESKWRVLRGFHVFRHSFASNLARRGTQQDVIDEIMGHQTEEMRKRYRHLFPEEKDNAVKGLFG